MQTEIRPDGRDLGGGNAGRRGWRELSSPRDHGECRGGGGTDISPWRRSDSQGDGGVRLGTVTDSPWCADVGYILPQTERESVSSRTPPPTLPHGRSGLRPKDPPRGYFVLGNQGFPPLVIPLWNPLGYRGYYSSQLCSVLYPSYITVPGKSAPPENPTAAVPQKGDF